MMTLKEKALRAVADVCGAVLIVGVGVVLMLAYFDVLNK